jgi:hypothetical protein
MGDSENNYGPDTAPNSETSHSSDERPLLPWLLGAAVVLTLVVGAVVIGRWGSGAENAAAPNPYIARLEITGLHMATAENFAGGRVTYIEGTLANHGDRKVTAARIEIVFKDVLGQIAQKDALPVMVVQPNIPYLDYGPLDLAPLAPGQTRDFRLTIEHITTEWDGQVPQAKVVSVSAG